MEERILINESAITWTKLAVKKWNISKGLSPNFASNIKLI